MYISKLHLEGFKSFLNKTDLNFGEGVTAVVGPNGCGKSNIVDAIRWILGEQKISILRSTKMEDVIFNGTKNRKPLSFCEASMLIHNNRGILPIEYNDVEISRRLYRSGESEFYINKNLCRLKDIQNLFVDTGMSSNAYSVIELKMVDSILSNNASERRHMFEEAAGINHYKQQRQAALRKMTATQSDMERVNDIILEVNNSIKNLKLQVKRFERFEKLTEKQKSLNIETARAEIQIIKSKQAPLQEKLNLAKSSQSSISGQMNLDETLSEKVQASFEEKKSQLSNCQQEISKLENKITELNGNLLVWAEKILGNANHKLHFQDEVQHNEENLSTSTKKISKLIIQKDKLLPEIKKRQSEYKNHKRKYQKVKSDYGKILRDQDDLKKQTETIFLKIREEEGMLERLKTSISEIEQRKDSLDENLTQCSQKIENSKAGINLVRADIEKQENENRAFSIDMNKIKTQHSKLEENILNLKDERNKLQSKQSTLQAQLIFYTNIIENHDGRPEGVKNILNDQKKYPFVLGVLSDIIEVDEPYQKAVESALGEYNIYLVVDSRKNAQTLIEAATGPLSIFVLDSIPEIAGEKQNISALPLLSKVKSGAKVTHLLDFLIGDVYILPSHKLEPDPDSVCSWVSESGNYYSRGCIYKSSGKTSESVIGRKQKLDQLQKDYEETKKQSKKLESELKTVIKAADASRISLQLKTEELKSGIQKLNELEQKLNQQQYISARHQESVQGIKENQHRSNTQIIDLNIRLKTVKDSIHNLRAEYEKSSEEYDVFQEKMSEERSTQSAQQQNLQNSRIKLLEIEKEQEGLDYRIDTLSSQETELKIRIQKYNSEISRIDKKEKGLQTSISEGKEKLVVLSNSLELSNKEKDELERHYNKSYEELQRLQSGIRERQKQKDEYLTAIREYEIAIAESTNEIKQHRSRIQELYNEEISGEAVNLDDLNLASRKAEIENIQRSLDRIGPVNLAVAEEYEKESERYTFLTEQYADLEESEKTIKETIEKLNAEAQKKFMDTFTAIQKNFTKTYSSFFDGGEGHLRLVGEDDPLEAEIKIIAQPPGKKTQTLHMLSAGEKALTAIALLFAIYLVKPSPFCILDEVDAPLDDTNIGKFAKVLKEFSNKTQFIVVTHNKLTMEKADYMYGITQEEEGVSKIVSVKFGNGQMKEFA